MDLIFSTELDGFSFCQEPFILKRIVSAPIQGGPPMTFTVNTDFLFDEPPDAHNTYQYATHNIHGLPAAPRAFPYDSSQDVLTSYLKTQVYTFQECMGDYSVSFTPYILQLCKGYQKVVILTELLSQDRALAVLEIQNLEQYGCPTAISLTGCHFSTGAKAAVFAAWMKGRFQDSIPAILSSSQDLCYHFRL